MHKMKVLFMLGTMLLVTSMLLVSGASSFISGGSGISAFSQHSYQPSYQTYYSSSAGGGLGPMFSTYWTPLDENTTACDSRQDLIIQVAPAGCQPTVVRSDLLAEQNVPVFCQLDALKLNPLIDIDEIESLSFSKEGYPSDVAGVGFHPARAALRTSDVLLGSPVLNNIGYVVVVLKKNPVENSLPDSVSVNLTANVRYESGNSLGIGRGEFYLTPQNDAEWERTKSKQSFWQGRYSVRLEEADSNFAVVSIYYGDRKISTVKVDRGKSSNEIYIPGGYCRASLKVVYDALESAQEKATIEITDGKGKDTLDVYEGSKFLNGKCEIKDISLNPISSTGQMKVSCRGNSDFIISLGSRAYSIGSDLEYLKDQKVYAGPYRLIKLGKELPSLGSSSCEINLTDSSIKLPSDLKNSYYTIRKGHKVNSGDVWDFSIRDSLNDLGKSAQDSGITNTQALNDIKTHLISVCEKRSTILEKIYDAETERTFNDTISAYERVAQQYPSEKDINLAGRETYGQKALIASVELAKNYNKFETQIRLMQQYINLYPESDVSAGYEREIEEMFKIDGDQASAVVSLDNRYKSIRLTSLSAPSIDKTGASFRYGTQKIKVGLQNKYDFTTSSGEEASLVLDRITSADRVVIKKVCPEDYKRAASSYAQTYGDTKEDKRDVFFDWMRDLRNSAIGSSILPFTVRVGDTIEVCGKTFTLESVDIAKYAKIRIDPSVENTETKTNVKVNIGIEKRAIQLNPAKTNERVIALNESIKKWESINKNLGNIVSGLKGACFATAGVLTIKSFLAGVDGTTLARQHAMQGQNGIGGWNQICKDAINNKRITRPDGTTSTVDYKTLTECFNKEEDNINREIGDRKNALENVNNNLKNIESSSGITQGNLVSGKSVDTTQATKLYLAELKSKCARNELDSSVCTTINSLNESDSKGNAPYRYSDLRELHYQGILKKEGYVSADKAISSVTQSIENSKKSYASIAASAAISDAGYGMQIGSVGDVDSRKPARASIADITGTKENGNYKNVNLNGKEIILPASVSVSDKANAGMIIEGTSEVSTNGVKTKESKNYLVVGNKEGNRLNPQAVYEIDKTEWYTNNKIKIVEGSGSADTASFRAKYGVSGFESSGNDRYVNKIRSEDLKVRYFETGPDKGFAAVVPFDTDSGWYAKVESSLAIGNQIKSYDASGLPRSWKVCNIGTNRILDDGDDSCQLVMEGVSSDQPILGLDASTSKTLVQKSRSALLEANKQKGSKLVKINGVNLEEGTPYTQFSGVQCQDFMAVEDCRILFNVCDPVICPATRCNLGGEYQVSNVAQTGIIGSTLLCLPNIREGVIIPVCLTGINAGIESYVSILKSSRDCLQENIASGKTVGICDQITSIYMCEFFWRQIAPVAKIILPKLIEAAYTGSFQGARGGGEYLTVMGAWDNMQSSISYFKDNYAVNSLNAFRARSMEEAGGEFCKAFISAKAPKQIDALLQPDSPPQFTASFSSVPFSDATVPATSQYKVFYHIFAGKDAGIYYRVYLKNPPTATYYATSPVLQVESGYIGKGEYRSQTRDFTAPVGYKELCVDINGEERCGFGEVTTSFAVNYLRDSFAKDELTRRDITSEKACVSGSPSLLGVVANTNPQAAVEQGIAPQDYQRGIVRICATQNPGASTSPSRYIEVGYCGDQKMKCWLDQLSVDNAISDENIGVRNRTLTELESMQKDLLGGTGGTYTEGDAIAKIKQHKSLYEVLASEYEKDTNVNDVRGSVQQRLDAIDNDFGKSMERLIFNNQRATVLMLKAQLNAVVSKVALNKASLVRQQQLASLAKSDGTLGIPDNRDFGLNDGPSPSTVVDETVVGDIYRLDDKSFVQGVSSADFETAYLRYVTYGNTATGTSSTWEWTVDQRDWTPVNRTIADGTASQAGENILSDNMDIIINNLIGESYDSGGKMLLEQGAKVMEYDPWLTPDSPPVGAPTNNPSQPSGPTIKTINIPSDFDLSSIIFIMDPYGSIGSWFTYDGEFYFEKDSWQTTGQVKDKVVEVIYPQLKGKTFEEGIKTLMSNTNNPDLLMDLKTKQVIYRGPNDDFLVNDPRSASGDIYANGLAFAFKNGNWAWYDNGKWVNDRKPQNTFFARLYTELEGMSKDDGITLIFSINELNLFTKLI